MDSTGPMRGRDQPPTSDATGGDNVLIRPHDANEAEAKALLDRNRFGLLIAPGHVRELPVVVPTHAVYDGAHLIRLHLARPNPILATIRGPARRWDSPVAHSDSADS